MHEKLGWVFIYLEKYDQIDFKLNYIIVLMNTS